MAQYNTANNTLQTHNKTLFETNMIASTDGYLISNTNPFPVSIRDAVVNITGPVNVTNEVEVTNSVNSPIPISANNTVNSPANPIYVVPNHENPYSADWHLQVARGKVAGISGVSITGYNPLVPVSATYIPIWERETTYTYPVTAQQMLLYSTSASDTNVTVNIVGLDSNYDVISEDIVLTNGTTGVTTVNSYLRINGFQVKLSSTVNPVGSIVLGNAGKTIIYSYIAAGTGKSQAAIYTVPRNHTFYLTRVNVYCGTVQQGQSPGNVTYRVQTFSPTGIVNNVVQTPFSTNYDTTRITPRPYTEKTDIQWQVICQIATPVGFQNEGLLILNTTP
jgi:hypothetical protein